ncbi:Roundabout 4, partial [Dryobates pubescens]
LRDNFRLQPGDLVATAGQVLELDCVPPSGHPEPRVTWKKDGVTLDLAGGRYVVTKGKLKVAPARRSDSGLYVCVAANAAGERQSRGAHVSVLGRREAAPRDLLAMRPHLDNVTMLPTAAVQLRWQMLPPVPALVSFMVLYRSLLPTSTSWVQHDAGKLLSTIIPQLRRGHQYEFKVRPYSGGTQGLDSNSRHLWIPEEVPSAAPQRVTVGRAEAGNGTVVVSWEPPPPEAHNGIIQGYKVWG